MQPKKATILGGLVFAVGVVSCWFYFAQPDHRAPPAITESMTFSDPKEPLTSPSRTILEASGAYSDDCLGLLGETARTIPAEAAPFVRKAIAGAALIEQQKRPFKPHSPGFVLLAGLQQKLFVDDYNSLPHSTLTI